MNKIQNILCQPGKISTPCLGESPDGHVRTGRYDDNPVLIYYRGVEMPDKSGEKDKGGKKGQGKSGSQKKEQG